MNNMFSGNQEKEIPKNFNYCYKNNSLINSLWAWCKGLEIAGIVLACIMGGLTFIFGIILFEDTDGGSILLSLFGAPIIALLEYLSFHILALLIGAKASIVQHTRISANIALYKFATENDLSTNNAITNNNVAPSTDISSNKLSKIITGKTSNNVTKKFCPYCGNPIKSRVCDMCGKENNLF